MALWIQALYIGQCVRVSATGPQSTVHSTVDGPERMHGSTRAPCHAFLAWCISVRYRSILVLDCGTIISVPYGICSCCCIVKVHNYELHNARKAWGGTLVDPCFLFDWCWANVYITNQFSVQLGGGGREGDGAMGSCFVMESCYPVTSKYHKSIKTMLKLTFYPNTHVYQHNTHKML